MTIKTTLKPGQKGTKRLVEKYGDRLINVRYRYDETASKRYTTVELIEDVSDWEPMRATFSGDPDVVSSQRLAVRVDYWETELRYQVKAAGGIWRPRQKLWEIDYKNVVALGLESRVVGEGQVISD